MAKKNWEEYKTWSKKKGRARMNMHKANDGQEVVLLRFFYRFPEGARLGVKGWKDIAEIAVPVRK